VNGIWHTRLNRTNIKLSTCTCPSYFRDYICKHILGVAAITKINPIPNETKAVCIEQKAPRGSPAKAKKALEYQAPGSQFQASVAKSSKRKAQETEIQEPPKKRRRKAKAKPVSMPEPESITEPTTEPPTSNLLIIRPRRNTNKK
jgi:uncharacterized Zn finger protein